MSDLVLPWGVEDPRELRELSGPPRVEGVGMIVNESDLPDDVVFDAIEEHASVMGVGQGSAFTRYGGTGSLLARAKFRVPTNVFDEIMLSRDMADRDDDVGNAMGAAIELAFGDGMGHTHEDEITLAVFDEIARNGDFDAALKELYREWLIAASVTTATAFTAEALSFSPSSRDRQRTRTIAAPLVGVLPAEQIRVLGDDLFGTAPLGYKPATGAEERWLREFFDSNTTPARRAEMQRENRLRAQLFVEQIPAQRENLQFAPEDDDPAQGDFVYRLNPRMAHRATMPKGSKPYARPLLVRNFSLLEAKRLLNLMDYALLQGGANFLIVAKKGSDQKPGKPEEIANLHEVIKRASRTGVIIGDHRLNIEIITPNLTELLSDTKRRLLGRKLANAVLRLPEDEENAAAEGVKLRTEILTRVVAGDRRAVRRLVERGAYAETVKRNPGDFPAGAPGLWFPKIILQGMQFFTDAALKLRDRGDISRQSTVAVAGFDWDNEVQRRKREKPDDRTMLPAAVPFNSPNAAGTEPKPPGAPGDNSGGRPAGSSQNNGRGTQPRGETVTAMFEEEVGVFRVGELTYRILELYPDRQQGRMNGVEQRAVRFCESGEWPGVMRDGPVTVVPVNEEHALADHRVLRLASGLSMIVGYRDYDGALLARAFCFREPEFQGLDAEERALSWGYNRPQLEEETS